MKTGITTIGDFSTDTEIALALKGKYVKNFYDKYLEIIVKSIRFIIALEDIKDFELLSHKIFWLNNTKIEEDVTKIDIKAGQSFWYFLK